MSTRLRTATALCCAALLLCAAGCRACTEGAAPSRWRFHGSGDAADVSETVDVNRDAETPLPDLAPRLDGAEDDTSPPPADCVVRVSSSSPPRFDLQIRWTADDYLEGFLDGSRLGASSSWTQVATAAESIRPGRHVVAVRAEDRARVVSGFIASLSIESESPECLQTGAESAWRATTRPPPSGWRSRRFDDSGWEPPTAASPDCRQNWDPRVDLEHGAWIWQSNCQVGAPNWHERNWYRLVFEVVPER